MIIKLLRKVWDRSIKYLKSPTIPEKSKSIVSMQQIFQINVESKTRKDFPEFAICSFHFYIQIEISQI